MSRLAWIATPHQAATAAQFGKVAVLLGGDSSEREISLISGNAVLAALKQRGIDAHPFDPAARPIHELLGEGFDRAWNILHGPGGEDGVIQGALEWLGVPYTGSGVLASALTMDKLKTKRVAIGADIRAPSYVVLNSARDLGAVAERLGLPLIVKPASQGSSVGISKVKTEAELPAAYQAAAAVDPIVFAEQFIAGPEYTVSMLHGQALPSIRIEAATEFYDYEAKYFRDDTQYHCPSGTTKDQEAALGSMAVSAFEATDCFGWGRVDFIRDAASGDFYFIEINTTPGMTSHSLMPMAAQRVGIDFPALCWQVLESSFQRQRK